jgi:protoheme IX farnesyltransferase
VSAAFEVVARRPWRAAASAYLQLTKPRIISLLLITTVPAMILAERGVPSLGLMAATLAGGMLTAGGANAINQFVDRDIDELMSRTRGRPLPGHRIEPGHALAFGIGLGALGFAWLTITVNLLSALLAVAAILFYVFVYTMWLKRTSPQNIVIGGAAGAVPVLVGWAAVTNTVALPAWVLFAVVFMWTPPHFWALAVRYRGDYAAAGVPMLPVVAGVRTTTRHILTYAILLVPITLVLWPAAHMGLIYVAAALVLGAWFVAGAVRLHRATTGENAMRLFRVSVLYLGLLFAAVAVDTLVRYAR